MIVSEGVNWEVLVVDNNSKDETRELIEKFSRRTLNLKYLFEARQGKSFALNRGIESAKGEIIAFTDDDVLMDKEWLTAVIKATQQYQDYDGFGGRIISLWKTRLPEWLAITGEYNSLRGTGYLRDDGCNDKEYSETKNEMPCGANMFFRKRAIEENGLFRLDLGPKGKKLGAAEDTEYCSRMLQSGKRFMYIGKALLYHQVEAEKLTRSYLARWRYYCARSVARSKGLPDNTRCYFDVPRYLIKQLFECLIKWNLSIDSKRRFYQKLKFYWTLGEIVESYKMRRDNYNIRTIRGLGGK